MTEQENYKYLCEIMKHKEKWESSVEEVARFLYMTPRLQAKALWILGEIGLRYTQIVKVYLPRIVEFLDSEDSKLRERAIGALGRIGRGNYFLIKQYWEELFKFAKDSCPNVRLSFIWTSENIATNTPKIYENAMPIFEQLLHDSDTKVRIEAPEFFRVIGKRDPAFVLPYLEELKYVAENDENRVVRIHSLGAVRITKGAMEGVI